MVDWVHTENLIVDDRERLNPRLARTRPFTVTKITPYDNKV